MDIGHWSETSVQLTFTLAIFFLGLGTIIGGLWQDRVGPRKVASVAGVIYGLGYIGHPAVPGGYDFTHLPNDGEHGLNVDDRRFRS